MDSTVAERRMDARHPPGGAALRATLRPGCLVVLVDVSAGGALIQGPRPLRPGARVHLQVVTDEHTYAIAAHVLRCAVWALGSDGVTYRGALKFEDRCEWQWETTTHDAPGAPASGAARHRERGHHPPTHAEHVAPANRKAPAGGV